MVAHARRVVTNQHAGHGRVSWAQGPWELSESMDSHTACITVHHGRVRANQVVLCTAPGS